MSDRARNDRGLYRIDGLTVRADVAAAMTGEVGKAVDAIAEQARHMIPSHQSAVSYIPDGNFEVATHATSFSEKYARYRTYDVMPTGEGIWSVIFEQGIAMRLTESELYNHPRFRNFSDRLDERGLEHPPMPGWLAVPVQGSRGSSIGLLQLSDKIDGEFTAEDEELLTRLAAVIAPTFEVHYFHEKLRARTSELELAKAELERSNKDLEQFAYVASHDLKAPLRAIDNLSSWLEEDLGETIDGDNREKLQLLRGRVKRMNRLLDDLLQYSRAGRTSHARTRVEPGQLVAEAVRLLSPPAEVSIELLGESSEPFVTEVTPLEVVLRNLIHNAFKHHDRSSAEIKVSWRRSGDRMVFTILDDGPGIPAELRAKAFQLFQTLKPRDQGGGSGMGLALIRRLVERAGGEVTLEDGPERGTKATFTWPITDAAMEPA